MKEFPSLPHLDEEKCIGCGLCIPACPGQAIFVVEETYSHAEALVSFPYEFLPLPEVGMEVDAVNREGKVVTRGRVIKVKSDKKYDRTVVVTIAVPKEWAEEVRGISLKSVKKW
jgi:Fe-S-cluster-containing hydrogenase component 2